MRLYFGGMAPVGLEKGQGRLALKRLHYLVTAVEVVYFSCCYCMCIVWSNGMTELVIVKGAKRHRVAYVASLCYL
jgi:hypothetical protein